jgi:hypothetical protein
LILRQPADYRFRTDGVVVDIDLRVPAVKRFKTILRKQGRRRSPRRPSTWSRDRPHEPLSNYPREA